MEEKFNKAVKKNFFSSQLTQLSLLLLQLFFSKKKNQTFHVLSTLTKRSSSVYFTLCKEMISDNFYHSRNFHHYNSVSTKQLFFRRKPPKKRMIIIDML